jgi:hypothetical protein
MLATISADTQAWIFFVGLIAAVVYTLWSLYTRVPRDATLGVALGALLLVGWLANWHA